MPRHEISLNGDGWQIGQCLQGTGIDDVLRWIPASVPGDVRADLLRANMIDDPFVGKQNELSRWVEDYNWWYRREVQAPPGPRRTFIRFEGIDYKYHIFFNGRRLLDGEGMFAPVIVEVTDLLSTVNVLAVNVEYAGQFRVREQTMKCQMSFGWDFAPTIKTSGIWDSVALIRTGDAYIRSLRVEPVQVAEDYWEAQVTATVDSRKEIRGTLDLAVEGANFSCEKATHQFRIEAPVGVSEHSFAVPMKKPALWSPWEQGKQNLYLLTATLRDSRRAVDATSTRFGMRAVELAPNENRPNHLWTFVVNGKRTFVRGANWTPADSLFGRLDRERYEKLLRLAKHANINMLRVWGGGLREKKDFYELCDEMGILVWQEMPFACGMRPYPKDAGFRKLAKKETTGILTTIFNHPSIVFYSGGNEINLTFNRWLVNLLDRQFRKLGGGRPFRAASPVEGESHNYRVWHALGNVDEYLKEDCSFLSEFGMQGVPARETLDFIIPRARQWPLSPQFPFSMAEFSFLGRAENVAFIHRLMPGGVERENAELWTYHDAQLTKMFRYAEQAGFAGLESFIDATQRMQAHGLQVAVEHMRRRKYEASGVMFWQFSEPWPTICWSVVDWFFRPKKAYHKLRELYAPLFFSLQFPLGPYERGQQFAARTFIINDLHRAFKNVKIEVRLIGGDGEEVARFERAVPDVLPDSIAELEPIAIALAGEEGWRIECAVSQGKKIVSRNSYDLSIADKKPTMKIMMLGDWLLHNVLWK
jgi:beta-mannosidase